jgi:ElaB/YqjD/DUF883 family membrane-anchored ribosome-binding protein
MADSTEPTTGSDDEYETLGVMRAQDLAKQVSEAGKQAASNLYDQGSRSGEYVRQYVAQEPLAAMLIAGVIGYTIGYLIHRR